MEKCYMVPVTSKVVKVDGVSLFDMLLHVDSELYAREENRVTYTYDLCMSENYISHYNSETSELYRERRIPEKLCFVENAEGIQEIITGRRVTGNPYYLKAFAVEAKPLLYHGRLYLVKDKNAFDVDPLKESMFLLIEDTDSVKNFVENGLAKRNAPHKD